MVGAAANRRAEPEPLRPRDLVGLDFSSVDNVPALVRARGGRATSSRRIHLEVLFDTDAHLSAEDLAAAVQAREAKEELGFTIDPHHFGVLRCCRVRS